MRWGQISAAAAIALAGGTYLSDHGYRPVVAVLSGVIIYVSARWAIAWLFRTKFWYRRGGSINNSDTCPNCEQRIYRLERDWILRCGRCGWTAGWPGLRWITRSVPAQQLRRTVVGPQLLLVILAVSGLFAPAAVSHAVSTATNEATSLGDSATVADNTPAQRQGTGGSDSQTTTQQSDDGGGTAAETPASASELVDRAAVRTAFQEGLNKERTERGLQPVTRREVLWKMGDQHAANMAEHDYIGHRWPDGTTIEDRYQQRGLLPECRLPLSGSDKYYAGAENAAGAWIGLEFRVDDETYYATTEEELGEALVEIWMNSDGHRRAMLVESADEMGLGLYIKDSGEVYAALELC